LVGNSLQNFLCVFRTLLFNLNHQLYLVGGRQRQANGISDFYNSCYAFDDNKKAGLHKNLYLMLFRQELAVASKHQCILFGGDKGETFHQVEILLAQIAQESDPEKRLNLLPKRIIYKLITQVLVEKYYFLIPRKIHGKSLVKFLFLYL
jgi:hypothetical protein